MPQKVDETMFMLHTSCKLCVCLILMSIPMAKEVHFFDAHRLAPPLQGFDKLSFSSVWVRAELVSRTSSEPGQVDGVNITEKKEVQSHQFFTSREAA